MRTKKRYGRRGGQLGKSAYSSEALAAFLLIAPAAVIFAFVAVYPFLSSLSLAFFERSLLTSESRFVGLDNLISTLTGDAPRAAGATVIFAGAGTVMAVGLGLVSALTVNSVRRLQGLARGILLFPWVMPGAVIAFLWAWIFNANYGVLNGVLRGLNIIDENVYWLGDSRAAMFSVILVKSWHSFPWIMIFFLAALQTIPPELYEAAQVDGAGALMQFWHVTLPHLRPVIVITCVLEVIGNFQEFQIIYVLTQGGPAGATSTFALTLYEHAFQGYDLGRAAALGLVWVVSLAVLATIYFRILDRTDPVA